MSFRRKLLSLIAIASSFGGLSCSSSASPSSSAQPNPITSQPSDKVANTLTAAQATQVCEEMVGYMMASLGGSICMSSAIAASQGMGTNAKAACESAYSQCLTADAGANSPVSCSMASLGTADCTATIGQINQCVVDRTASTKAAASALSCDLAGVDSDASASVANPAAPASCAPMQQSCSLFYQFITGA